jgi:hypothetical protein
VQGERALRKVDGAVEIVEEEMLTGLDAGQRSALHALLARLDVGEPDWGLIADDA